MNFAQEYDSDEYGLYSDSDDSIYDFQVKNISKKTPEPIVLTLEEKLQQLYTAISLGRYEEVIESFDNGLDINARLINNWTPLLLSAAVGNAKIFKEIVRRGVDLHQKHEESTILHLACNTNARSTSHGDEVQEMIEIAVEKGIDPNEVDRKRRTALMLAAYNGHAGAVHLLLPLTDRELEDNQYWTALFWAVEGNQVKIAEYLLANGSDPYHTDIRHNNAIQLAENNGFYELVDVFCKENEHVGVTLQKNISFNEIFEDLGRNNLPIFFNEIGRMLCGCSSENVAAVIAERDVSLQEFLSLDERKLVDLGVQLPFQRKRIVNGLFKFHKRAFNRESMPFVPKHGLFSNLDVGSSVLSAIRQVIAMQASLVFISNHLKTELKPNQRKELRKTLINNQNEVKRLMGIIDKFSANVTKWDSTLKSADKITKKRWNIPWGYVFASSTLIPLVLLARKLK